MPSRRSFLHGSAALAAGRAPRPPLVAFPEPWSSPFRADPLYRHQLVNEQGRRLWILNKTAWAYFGCRDPRGVLERARAQGVNVIRVALEGVPYFKDLGIELWPWGGTRDAPRWNEFNAGYWRTVEERIRLAGNAGIGLDVVLYMHVRPEADAIPQQRPYWQRVLDRLSGYANILTWEIANEHTANESFQDAAAAYLRERDPFRHPVCTSDGTTDDAVWPHKEWMDLAIVHTCTSSTPAHDLDRWYRSVARNTRSYGKPAFNNESGREKRHRNDDPVHRRKQGWVWCCSGAFWTWHSWEGCEGIDDAQYRGPGAGYLKPMADFFRGIAFWTLDPKDTTITAPDGGPICCAMADAERKLSLAYLCTRAGGETRPASAASVRLPAGRYAAEFYEPATMRRLPGSAPVESRSLGQTQPLALPEFTDDLLVVLRQTEARRRAPIPGTR